MDAETACDYCGEDAIRMLMRGPIDAYIDCHNNCIHLESFDVNRRFSIHYCPMCGRALDPASDRNYK